MFCVKNYPWSRSSRDSISQMLNRCPLETRSKQSRLLLLFTILYICISMKISYQSIVQVELTRARHSIQLIRPYARMYVYLNCFFPHTVWVLIFMGLKFSWISWGSLYLVSIKIFFACILIPAAHDRLLTFFKKSDGTC